MKLGLIAIGELIPIIELQFMGPLETTRKNLKYEFLYFNGRYN